MGLLSDTPITGSITPPQSNGAIVGLSPTSQGKGGLLSQTPIVRDLYDETIGAALYGGADILGLGSRALGAITPGEGENNVFTSFGNTVHQWQQEHPQYAPEEVGSALELLKNPG